MPAKLLPERYNLYGNSLDFKLNIWKKKNQIPGAHLVNGDAQQNDQLTTNQPTTNNFPTNQLMLFLDLINKNVLDNNQQPINHPIK